MHRIRQLGIVTLAISLVAAVIYINEIVVLAAELSRYIPL